MERGKHASESIDTYDCRVCRRHGLPDHSRVCLLDRPSAVVSQRGAVLTVDRESAVALCADSEDMLAEFKQLKAGPTGGRELCFVPCIHPRARELMASETDCKEYGVQRPTTRRHLEAYRVIRAERCSVEMERMKRDREEAKRRG
jgi:hypothetical protein